MSIETRINVRPSYLAILALSLASPFASAQATWTYDATFQWNTVQPGWFFNDNVDPQVRLNTPINTGFKHSGDPLAISLNTSLSPGLNGSVNFVDGNTSYDLADDFRFTMGWTPHYRNLTDNGTYADNEIMQMGLVAEASSSSLLGITPSLFLSAIENTASRTTNVTNSFLAIRTQSGIEQYFNGGATYAFEANKYYLFQIDFEKSASGDPSEVNISLAMNVYTEPVPDTSEYVYSDTVNFGTLSNVENPLAGDTTLYPALGHTLRDANKVSISGAHFDVMPATIPEPSNVALLLLSAMAALSIRRRL
jgi:hypothetical protein